VPSIVGDQALEIRIRDWEAGGYAISYRATVGAWWDDLECQLLIRAIRPANARLVLDAGSGVGRLTFALARSGYQVAALDFSFRSLRFLRARSSFPAQQTLALVGTLTDPLPIADGSVEAVVSCQVVQHIPTRELRARVWSHLAQAARPGAILATVVYQTQASEPNEGHFDGGLFYHRYDAPELRDELRSGGWDAVRLGTWYRRDWSKSPAVVSTWIERASAAAHLADKHGRYILATARRRDRLP
jgi:SAM-dependent methyltransferase